MIAAGLLLLLYTWSLDIKMYWKEWMVKQMALLTAPTSNDD